jgi:hypothetical protein
MLSARKYRHRSSANRSKIAKVHLLTIKLLMASFLAWLLPCALLVFSDSPASAAWVSVEKPYPVRELQTLYIDPSTIRREGNFVEVWQLTDYRWMQGGPKATPRFLSTITHKQFECMDKRIRLLASTEFSHRMAAGTASSGYVDKDGWLPVEPDSINEALWEILYR